MMLPRKIGTTSVSTTMSFYKLIWRSNNSNGDSYCDSKGRYTRGSLLPQHAPATDLLLELASFYLTSLIQWSKTREQKFCCATIFSHEIVGTDEGALLREHVAGASSLVCTGLKTANNDIDDI